MMEDNISLVINNSTFEFVSYSAQIETIKAVFLACAFIGIVVLWVFYLMLMKELREAKKQ